jgi:hypothetical protein
MGNIPAMNKETIPIVLEIPEYMRDHTFEGRAVLPAVEAMEILADVVFRRIFSHKPDSRLPFAAKNGTHADGSFYIEDAEFRRFLFIPENLRQIQAVCEVELKENGDAGTGLYSRVKAGKSGMSRLKEHVLLNICNGPVHVENISTKISLSNEKKTFKISPDVLYKELVPFGPAYQNLVDTVHLFEQGAYCRVRGGKDKGAKGWLGSPFCLDAAFHAACAWGQRFAGMVPFPVGIKKRIVFDPLFPGETAFAAVTFRKRENRFLVFDIRIVDERKKEKEAAIGVRMGDVSAGRLKPPGWVKC